MKGFDRFTWRFSLAFALALTGLYMTRQARGPGGLFAPLEFVWRDFLFRHNVNSLRPADPRLIMIAVDDDTLHVRGNPLPRKDYALALDRLKSLGVKTIVVDVPFLDPAPGDIELAAATRRCAPVVHVFSQPRVDTPQGWVTNLTLPPEPILKATPFFGSPELSDGLDSDGHARRYALFLSGVTDPLRAKLDTVSVAAAALDADQFLTLSHAFERDGTTPKFLNFRKPRRWLVHESRDAGAAWGNVDKVTSAYRRISLGDLLDNQLSDAQRRDLKGSLALIGVASTGYGDLLPTAFAERTLAADVHLTAIDNILHGDDLTVGTTTRGVLLLWAAVALALLLQLLPAAGGAATAAAALVGWWWLAQAQFRRGTLLEFVAPAVAFATTYVVLAVRQEVAEGAERRALKRMFEQFVAPEVVDELIRSPAKLNLGGEQRELSVFFLDIADYTKISEKMSPADLMRFLNRYLTALSQPILDSRGMIDKYIGDSIMAFWNAPAANPDHRAAAIMAALECQKVVRDLNRALGADPAHAPAIRIGVNTGLATVGMTGTKRRLQYTAIGDEVNLASRLEGANKFFGTRVIASAGAYIGAKDRVAARKLGRVRVVGKEMPVTVYEPVGLVGALDAEWTAALPLYQAATSAFDAGRFPEALDLFSKFVQLKKDDVPANLFIDRCRAAGDDVINLTVK